MARGAGGIGPLFNIFAHGGYLLWRLYPPRQVFHDGRMELDPELLQEIGAARSNSLAWERLMREHGVDGAVLRYEERRRPVLEPDSAGQPRLVGYRTENGLLFPRELYALVYWDDTAMVLVRRTTARESWLSRTEYLAIDPEDLEWTLSQAAADRSYAARAREEIERRMSMQPRSTRAARVHAALEEIG